MSTAPRETTAAPSSNEEDLLPLAIYHPPTGYEPNVLDDFHCSETSEMILQAESGEIDTEPSYLCDAELDDEIIGKRYLHHCSFRSEKMMRAVDRISGPKTSLSLSLFGLFICLLWFGLVCLFGLFGLVGLVGWFGCLVVGCLVWLVVSLVWFGCFSVDWLSTLLDRLNKNLDAKLDVTLDKKFDGLERRMDQVIGVHQTRLDKHDAELASQRQFLEHLKTEVSLLQVLGFRGLTLRASLPRRWGRRPNCFRNQVVVRALLAANFQFLLGIKGCGWDQCLEIRDVLGAGIEHHGKQIRGHALRVSVELTPARKSC